MTMPHWIGLRFGSRGFAIFFAIVNLLALAFVVLIVGGLSIVMQQMLHLSNTAALIIILVFVTGYVFIGGTYAHVFTNTLQGSLMIIVTLLIFASGLHFFKGEGLFAQIGAIDPNLTRLINPKSNLFNNIFSVYISGFLIGAALVCQPHILTKALYVRSDRALKQYLMYGGAILAVFLLLPFAGFFTRLAIPPEQLVDASSGAFRQDLAMIAYVHQAFPPFVFTFISVVLLAAGMSTLDGILVSMSTITSNDLIVNLIKKIKGKENSAENFALAYKLSHLVLVIIAVLAFLICLNPPKLLGIFGQVGVYGMAVAAVPPLLIGVLFKKAPLGIVWAAAGGGLVIHFFLYFLGPKLFPNAEITFANPGVTAALALLVSAVPAITVVWLQNLKWQESQSQKNEDRKKR